MKLTKENKSVVSEDGKVRLSIRCSNYLKDLRTAQPNYTVVLDETFTSIILTCTHLGQLK